MDNSGFTRGSTFLFIGTLSLTDAEGTPIDGTGWSISSDIRKLDGELIAPLVVDWIDPTERRFAAEFDGDTRSWPLGRAKWDLLVTGPLGQVIYTKTAHLLIEEGVTHATKV
ncbi:MAG: hypothetical protein CSA72_10640 [Rhodobacterales bacterium]|nr:MAG: hypothetical protein CSA72_10640 [Rhodobacterales bacterium]